MEPLKVTKTLTIGQRIMQALQVLPALKALRRLVKLEWG